MRNTTICRIMSPELPYYGQAITWDENYVLADGFPTLRAARIRAIQLAKRDGYTIPRWWQFWWWSDTNVLDWRKQPNQEG